MTVWVAKPGKSGQREHRMLEQNVIGGGWDTLPDLSACGTREDVERLYRSTYPDASDNRVANHVGQLFAFVQTAKTGDLVVLPMKTRSAVAIGKITGDYVFRKDLGPDFTHARPVSWLATDIPRTKFDQDLLYTFGAFMTFCRAKRNNAEERIRQMLNGKSTAVGNTQAIAVEDAESIESQDIEQHSRDQIMDYIGRKFRGHEMTRLVEAILKAQGFFTRRADPGPDGGVDILAAPGVMGFDSPRLCVQVKSSDSPADVSVYRSLVGTMERVKAENGLLVSWGGVKQTVTREAETSFFRVRIWDNGDLVNAILANYEKLEPEIQAELPLKRIWTLALPEIEE